MRVYVTDFGAVGDGVTDDAPAFQRAIDALAAYRPGRPAPGSAEMIGPDGKVVALVRVDVAEETPALPTPDETAT